MLAHPEAVLTLEQTTALEDTLQQLIASTPLPYIIGEWAFYGRQFTVTPAVLIPRPETELLIDLALSYLQENPTRQTVLDVGTGSGCIGITLAAEIPYLQVLAVDISKDAAVFLSTRYSASAARMSRGRRTCGSGGSNVSVDTRTPEERDDDNDEGVPCGICSIPTENRLASPELSVGLPAPVTKTGKYSIPSGFAGAVAVFSSTDTHSQI